MRQRYPDTHHDVSSNTIFGFWLYLMTDCVLFATFFATYAVLKTNVQHIFNFPFALAETLVLLTSSFTCGIAMVGALDRKKSWMLSWFGITFLLGLAFMYMELSEFQHLIAEGNTWQKNAFLSSYFALIGLHGLHIIAGLLAMILFILQMLRFGLTAAVLRRLTCLKIYWHFLYLIWIFTFTIVYLVGVK